jgi:hypothetical protein
MTMPGVVAISQPGQRRAIQKVADLFTGFLADHPPSWPLAPSDRYRASTAIERRYRLLV